MGDLSLHFRRSEFECHGQNCCGHTSVPNVRLIEALEAFREVVGRPVVVHSGFRCLTHNRGSGSEDTSQHVWGRAAVIHSEDMGGMTPDEMAAAAERVPAFRDGGIGLYDWGVHVDVRPDGPARWDKRTAGSELVV